MSVRLYESSQVQRKMTDNEKRILLTLRTCSQNWSAICTGAFALARTFSELWLGYLQIFAINIEV